MSTYRIECLQPDTRRWVAVSTPVVLHRALAGMSQLCRLAVAWRMSVVYRVVEA